MGLKDAAVNIFSAQQAAGWTVESRCAGGELNDVYYETRRGKGGARGAVSVGGRGAR